MKMRDLKVLVAERSRWRCVYCGRQCALAPGEPRDATVDHVVPRSRGGRTVPANLVLACRACNTDKGDRMPTEPRGIRGPIVVGAWPPLPFAKFSDLEWPPVLLALGGRIGAGAPP